MKTDKYIPTEYSTKLPSLSINTILADNPKNGYKIKILGISKNKGKTVYQQGVINKNNNIVKGTTTTFYELDGADLLVYYDSNSKKYKLNISKTDKLGFNNSHLKV